jgi:hypothetical protein
MVIKYLKCSPGTCLNLGSEVKNMVKYKCVKMRCPVCHVTGSAQLFLNKNGEVRYARVHHYKGLNKNKKAQFEYHKVEDLETLKTLLQNKEFQFSPKAKASKSQGQAVGFKTHDLHLRSSSFICQNIGAGSSARIEHHPPKVEVVGSNPTSPAETCSLYSGKISPIEEFYKSTVRT